MIVRLRKPIDQEKFGLRPDAKTENVGGKVLFATPGEQFNSRAYYFADEKTVVVSQQPHILRTWLAKLRPAGQAWNPTGWQEVEQKDAAMWVDVKGLRPGMAVVTQVPSMTGLGPFAVLWEQTDTLIAGGTLDDMLRIRATAHCPNAEDAERVEKTLAAAVTLGLNGVEAVKTRTPPGAGQPPRGS